MSHAHSLAVQGKTNAEIFAELGYSAGELKRRLKVDHQLMFDIVAGRREFVEPHITNLVEIAMGHSELPPNAMRAIMVLLERYDAQNKSLCIGYDLALLENLPTAIPTNPMDAMALTAALRASK